MPAPSIQPEPASAESSLGTRLAPLLGGGFFRPLARPTAAVYIDCADRLVEAADAGGQIPFEEARLLIREVLHRHPGIPLDEDEGGLFRDLNQRAAQFFNRLLEARWLGSRRVSLDEHYVLVTPALRRLLRSLREIGEDRPAELRDFAATLRSLCRDLLLDGALDPARIGPDELRQTLKDLVARAEHAEDQMHAVETLILRHEDAQRASGSARETLERFLVGFHAGDHMVCYDTLQQAGLLPRLTQARAVVQEALHNPYAKQRLAEGLASHLGIDPSDAYTEAEAWFLRLERMLASIPVRQRLIDGRMADFSRLSAARYRYQTEMRGRRPEQIKTYLDHAGSLHAGQSFADLDDTQGMPLLHPEVSIAFGQDSLARPRRARPDIDLSLDTSRHLPDPDAARDEIRRRNLHLLSPQRAARFVERHLPARGTSLPSSNLHLDNPEELLDLLSVLAFDRGPAARSGRGLRWRIHASREDPSLATRPDLIPRDPEAGRLLERFTLERLS